MKGAPGRRTTTRMPVAPHPSRLNRSTGLWQPICHAYLIVTSLSFVRGNFPAESARQPPSIVVRVSCPFDDLGDAAELQLLQTALGANIGIVRNRFTPGTTVARLRHSSRLRLQAAAGSTHADCNHIRVPSNIVLDPSGRFEESRPRMLFLATTADFICTR